MIILHLNLESCLFIILSGSPGSSNQDSNQIQFLINAAVGIVNVLVAALIPIWLFLAQNKRGLAYEINKDEVTYLTDMSTSPPTFQQAFRVILRLWNSGRQSIVPEDIYGPIEFSFGTNAEIRDVQIIGRNPPTLGVSIPTIGGSDQTCVLASEQYSPP